MIKNERIKNTLKRINIGTLIIARNKKIMPEKHFLINFFHNYSYNTDKNPKKDVSNHIMYTIKRNKK